MPMLVCHLLSLFRGAGHGPPFASSLSENQTTSSTISRGEMNVYHRAINEMHCARPDDEISLAANPFGRLDCQLDERPFGQANPTWSTQSADEALSII